MKHVAHCATRRISMKKLMILVAAFLPMLALTPAARAHRATERYIPIGASPGVSGKLSVIGTVEEMNALEEWMRIKDGEKTLTIKCNEKTRFWLDRTGIKKTNVVGSITDCMYGRRMEVRFVDDDHGACVAAWIKIEITGK